jgi:hypothetical protein
MGAQATGLPLLPTGFVAGTITISAGQAGTPQNLLTLVAAQLDANVSRTPYYIRIEADSSGVVYIGAPSPLLGALATTNYGRLLATGSPGGNAVFESYFPGAQPSGQQLSVLMSGSGTFHVEIR